VVVRGKDAIHELPGDKVGISEVLDILRNYRIQPEFFCRFWTRYEGGRTKHPV